MKFKYLLLFVMVIVGFAPPAYSERDLLEKCMEESQGISAAMINCTYDEYSRQEGRYDIIYGLLTESLPETRRQHLEASTIIWEKYDDLYSELLWTLEKEYYGRMHREMFTMNHLYSLIDRLQLLQAELTGQNHLLKPSTLTYTYLRYSKEISKTGQTCLATAAANSQKRLLCLEAELEKANKRIRYHYQRLTDKFSPIREKALVAFQKAWVDYTESYAVFLSSAGDDDATQVRVAEWNLLSAIDLARKLAVKFDEDFMFKDFNFYGDEDADEYE